MSKRNVPLKNEDILELEEFAHKTGVAIESKRAQAILMLEDKMLGEVIKKITGIDKGYAYKLRKLFIEKGFVGIREKKRKPRSLLVKKERDELLNILQKMTPRDFGYNVNFWTTKIVIDLIEDRFNVKYKSKSPIYVIFSEAKFTFHKPDMQYKNRDQKKIDVWTEVNKLFFEQCHHEENTIFLTEDELILTTQTTFQKIWLPQGSFPKIDVSNKKDRRCVYGFLNVKNGAQHAFKTKYINSEETIKALEEIKKIYPDKKIVIVWDNATWHKSIQIKAYLNNTKHNFHLINFVPYAPETNPQEHVWKAARANVTHNKFIENIDKATDDFVSYLNNSNFKYSFFNPVDDLVEF